MSDVLSIRVGEVWRKRSLVARADGSAITSGTVNYYLKSLTGANAGKWWKDSTETWEASETANAMTHQADGLWTIQLTSSPFAAGIIHVEYSKESGDLHVAGEGQMLRGITELNAAAVNAEVVDVVNVDTLVAGQTMTEALRRIGATAVYKVSGAGTGTETFVDWADSASTIVVTVDASGNRTAVTFN